MKKIVALVMAVVMLFSISVIAAETPEYKTTVTYVGNKTAAYEVTVPSTMAPGENYDVSAKGYWGSNRKLTVTAPETVTLTCNLKAEDTKTLTVAFEDIALVGNNTAEVSTTSNLAIANIENAHFGEWTGTIVYTVEMVNAQ